MSFLSRGAASAAFALTFAFALGQARPAFAGGEPFYVPVNLQNLPPQLDLLTVNCYVTDDSGRTLGGGDATRTIRGGAITETLNIIVRSPSTDAARPPTGYWCRLSLTGRLADGRPVNFWTSNSGAPTPWRSNAWPGAADMVLPSAPGSAPSLRVTGALGPEDAALLLAPGDCPCGCGGSSANGTRTCTSTTSLPQTPQLTPRVTPATPAPGRLPSGLRAPAAPTSTAKPLAVGTPTFVFRGTGALTTP